VFKQFFNRFNLYFYSDWTYYEGFDFSFFSFNLSLDTCLNRIQLDFVLIGFHFNFWFNFKK